MKSHASPLLSLFSLCVALCEQFLRTCEKLDHKDNAIKNVYYDCIVASTSPYLLHFSFSYHLQSEVAARRERVITIDLADVMAVAFFMHFLCFVPSARLFFFLNVCVVSCWWT